MAASKAEQDAEARARSEAGIDPGETAGALDVIDDGARGAPPDPAARQTAPEGEHAAKPAPPAKSAFDQRRADIVARFRTSRTEEAEAARDDISDFARSGMPPEFEPPAPPVEPAAEPAADPAAPLEDPPASQTYKVKVRGQEIEMSQEDLIAHAQKSLAGDSYLEEGKSKLKEVDALLRETRDKASRAGQDGAHHAAPQSAQPAEPASPDGADPQHPEDPIAKLIETIQFGDPAEARELLQNTIEGVANKAVATNLESQRMQDEGARAMKVLTDFEGQHPEIAKDKRARAAIESDVFDLQVEDIAALGVDPAKLRPDGQPPTSGDVALAHRWYRAKGFKVRTPQELLETATKNFMDWKGVKQDPKPDQTPADPASKAAPRVDLTVDRTARRQAIPQQPSRTVAPKPDAQQAPQARDRSDIVRSMAAKRNEPRGRVVA